MDSGRTIVYCLDGVRLFVNKAVATIALEASGETSVLREYIQTNDGDKELLLTHSHLVDGTEIVHDMPGTDEHAFVTAFPGDVHALRFGRYGDIESFEGSIDDFLELWARIKEDYDVYMQVRAPLVEAAKDAAYRQEGLDGVERVDKAVFPPTYVTKA